MKKEPMAHHSEAHGDVFSQVGKRMPFRTPDGSLARQKSQLKQLVRPRFSGWRYGIAASVLLAGLVYGVRSVVVRVQPAPVPVYAHTAEMEANEWAEFSEADVFMETMNW